MRGYDEPALTFAVFVPHRLNGWRVDLDGESVERVMVAEEAVRTLNDRCDPAMVLPAEWLIRRAEGAASTTIEGIHPSARRLARAEARLTSGGERPRDPDIEALRNIRAVEHALAVAAQARPVTVADIGDIHDVLMGDHPSAGLVRTIQNWIGTGSVYSTPLDAAYVPPPPEYVPRLLDDLVEYVNLPLSHPVVAMAVAHAQFEAIHPFGDGNGRTGRALMQLMLQRCRLSPACTVPISSSLALRRETYIDALDGAHIECRSDDPQRSHAMRDVVTLFADATADAARYAGQLIDRVGAIRAEWGRVAAEAGITPRSAGGQLLEHLTSNPALNAERAAVLLGSSWRTGARAVEQLEAAGILVQRNAGRRNRVFEAPAMTSAFAEAVNPSLTRAERAEPADAWSQSEPPPPLAPLPRQGGPEPGM